METVAKGLLHVFAAIAIVTGPIDIALSLRSQNIFGANLEGNGADDPALDNAFRFMAGVWTGSGFLFLQACADFKRYWPMLNTLLLGVAIGGIGRMYSIFALGWTPSPFGQALHTGAIVIECIICPCLAYHFYSTYGGEKEAKYKEKNA